MNLMKGLTKAFHSLSTETRELYLTSEVPVLSSPPSALEFYRSYVTPNLPVIIKNNLTNWPALKLWSSEYFREKIGDKEVTVAVTPNGYADAVVDEYFVMPEERPMKMSKFLDILDHKVEEKGIFYIQKQNSNFTEEFSEIVEDAALEIPWASEALGKCPDAVNFWMGDGQAITSMHKDHYENIYCVVCGSKTFTLIPPTDLPYVTYGQYMPARYKLSSTGEFEIHPFQGESDPKFQLNSNDESSEFDDEKDTDEGAENYSDYRPGSQGSENDADDEDAVSDHGSNQIPWVSIDPLEPDYQLYPDYAKAQPITCVVKAGETLYLPSLWFHHVQQTHKCIAVNFWYDMEYDVKYSYYKFLEKLSALVKD